MSTELQGFEPTDAEVEVIACACHLVNKAYCEAIGDTSQPSWLDAPDWQKDSARDGVRAALADPNPRRSHERWLAHKKETGWVYGDVKDPEKKTHPCMVPYDELPLAQRRKDGYFVDTVIQVAISLRNGGKD